MRQCTAADLGLSPPAPTRPPMPVICMLQHEFDALPEYSATFPTGQTIGKMWRRHDGAHDRRCKNPQWFVLQYVDHPDPKLVGIKWYRPILPREMIAADIGLKDGA